MNKLLTRLKQNPLPDGHRLRRSGVARATQHRLVVVGNGMVGYRFLKLLAEKDALSSFDITVFGAEPCPATDRVNLTRYLYGSEAESLELAGRDWYRQNGIELYTGDPVVLIDREEKLVHSRGGRSVRYDRLVLATGSRAMRPDVQGADQEGVFVYRDLEDLRRIKDRAARARSVAVIGGGLLGLEAAEAFKDLGLETHVIERGSGLMARQVNPEGAAVVQEQVEKSGVIVHNGRSTAAIESRGEKLEIRFQNGPPLAVSMVVFATGVRPRDELAKACALELGFRGGINVDDSLATSDPDVYAIGECASHRNTTYGLVLPGYEMAAVLADRFTGGKRLFRPADQSAILHLDSVEVAAVGEYQADVPSYSLRTGGVYRRIYVRGWRLVGAIGVGDWPEQARVREAVKSRCRIWPWNVRRFESEGRLWRPSAVKNVLLWPDAAEVCNCMSVCKGALLQAHSEGRASLEEVVARTGASTVCGSCRPLVAALLGAPVVSASPIKARPALLGASILAGLLVGVFLAVEIPFAETVGGGWKLETLWTDQLIKRVSGFTLVGLALLSLVLSLRKRVRSIQFGNFGHWRMVHSFLGVMTLAALVTHTGLHLGHNLNFLLTINFLALALFGALAGGVTALEARLDGALSHWLRRSWTTLHIVLVWPLPVLVLFHALASYYY